MTLSDQPQHQTHQGRYHQDGQKNPSSVTVNFTPMGNSKQSVVLDGISQSISATELLGLARSCLEIHNDAVLRLICAGKTIAQDKNSNNNNNSSENDLEASFPLQTVKIPKNGIVKIIVIGGATMSDDIQTLNSLRSDPLMRGFDDFPLNNTKMISSSSLFWGPVQSKSHFRRLEECPDSSFGTRPTSNTPHAFEARRLLDKLSSDPGIVAIMASRKLVVGTLGEMDPIDDVLMHKTHAQSGGAACLLGYNTNHGLRIDIKLRTEDLSSFRPYRQLVATLVHELSHNWVEEHDGLFWTNYGQMRVEYLWEHARLMMGGMYVNGKRTATLAEIEDMIVVSQSSSSSLSRRKNSNVQGGNQKIAGNENNCYEEELMMKNICLSVCQELEIQMTVQHGIPVSIIAPSIVAFGNELIEEDRKKQQLPQQLGVDGIDNNLSNIRIRGQKLGGGNGNLSTSIMSDDEMMPATMTPRERALVAAEERLRATKASSTRHNGVDKDKKNDKS